MALLLKLVSFSFRPSAFMILAVTACCASRQPSAAALAAASQLPLKYTALLGAGAMVHAMAADSTGSVYVAGEAHSPLPVTPGAFRTQYNPAKCGSSSYCPFAFAAKLSADGTALAYLTYLGASSSEAYGISVDRHGNAWITGTQASNDLPVTTGALQTSPGISFVVELNATGSQSLLATYFGGSLAWIYAQALDGSGNLYLTGVTEAADFPVTPGAFQTGHLGFADRSFVSKLDASGRLVYSTYFHGGPKSNDGFGIRDEVVNSIAVDAAGNAYITGTDYGHDLLTTPGAFQTKAQGQITAAFAAALNSTGSNLLYCTYLAANSNTFGNIIAVDTQNNAYVAGNLYVPPDQPSNFPVTTGAFQTIPPSFATAGDLGFLTKLNPTGSALSYSTFLYASGRGWPGHMTVDSAANAILVGYTDALDFPTTTGALYECHPGGLRGSNGWFVFKLAPDGSHPVYSTYLSPWDLAGVAVDDSGEIYIAGNGIGELPVIPGSFGWNSSGAFVVALAPVPLPAGSVSCVVNAANHGGDAIAPGEIVDLIGNGIGPAETVSTQVSDGQISTALGGTQVWFNGVPAPLLSAGPNQIRAVVPFQLAPANLYSSTPDAAVQIVNAAGTGRPFTVPVAPAAPAIFTATTGEFPLALMINEDGTLNSEQNPARRGSVVTVYATGLNNTEPPLATGRIPTSAIPLAFTPQLRASCSFQCQITYAGAAPGFVGGLTQVNIRILPSAGYGGRTSLSLGVSDFVTGGSHSFGTPLVSFYSQ